MYRITQCLSVGPFASAERVGPLLAAGVTHVLNVSDGPSHISAGDGFADVAWVPMSDSRRLMPSTAVRALDTLHELVSTPDAHVYVHCVMGMVRSPTILWLYLIACGLARSAHELIETRSPDATAGHFRMVDHEHILLAQKHGLAHFFPHPRPDLIVPFPLPEERVNTPLAYLNGRLLPFAEAALPLHDAGFVSGATVVDNARTFRHKLFRWSDHLARFRRDCAACYVPLDATDEHITATAEELVAHNAKLLPPGGELQLVTFATPGPLGFYLGESNNGPPTLGMVTYPLPFARYRRFFTEGVTLAVAGVQSSHSHDLLAPRVKHRSRLHWHIAGRTLADPNSDLRWQLAPPATDPSVVPVVFNGDGGTADTAIGAVLAVMGQTVLAQSWVQDSISTRVVLELGAAVGLTGSGDHTLEMGRFTRPASPEEEAGRYPQPTELLLAGTGFCLAGVKRFGFRDHCRDFTWPGPVFRQLLAAWSDLVGVDIAKQFTEAGV